MDLREVKRYLLELVCLTRGSENVALMSYLSLTILYFKFCSHSKTSSSGLEHWPKDFYF